MAWLSYARVLVILKTLLALVCVLGFAAIYQVSQTGIRIESDLKKLFPDSPAHPLVNQVNDRLFAAFGNSVVMGLSGADKSQLLAANAKLTHALSEIAVLTPVDPSAHLEQQAQQQALLLSYRYGLLTDAQRARLTQALNSDAAVADSDAASANPDAVALRQDAARALLGFRTTGLNPLEDPFNLAQANLQRLQMAFAGELEDGLVIIETEIQTGTATQTDTEAGTQKELLLLNLLQLQGEAFSLSTQDAVRAWIDQLRADLNEEFAGRVRLQLSGAVFHAAEASANARREMSVIGIGSLAGILLLFALAFRRAAPLLLTLASVAFGCGFAFVATLAIFGYVHVITLVFGASLIGVAVDYSLHYLCKQQAHEDAATRGSVRRKLLPALGLSLVTSVLGYSCLLQTPLVGLQQIAAFSVLGLIAAWLLVVVIYPKVAPTHWQKPAPVIDQATQFFWRILGARGLRMRVCLGVMAAAIVIVGLTQLSISRDLRTLYKPSADLMASEQYLQQALKGVSPNQYFLIKAADPQALLTREAQFIREKLTPLIHQNDLLGVVATSQWVPSAAQQSADYQLMGDYLYGATGDGEVARLFNDVGLGAEAAELAQVQYRAAAGKWLAPDDWLAVARPDQALLWQGEYAGEYVSIVALRGVTRVTELAALADGESVIFVDRVGDLSHLLRDLIETAAAMLVWAYLAIALLLLAIYRRPIALLVAAVPLVSSLLAIALLSLFEVPINLFHVFGCYLILGLGIDYAIFAFINGDKDLVARRAIWLAAMTSSLSFGLLALSVTPMVQAFGMTLALGCLFNLLLAPLVSGYGYSKAEA